MTGKEIGAHSHMHKTKVSRAVALLERRKLLARKANRADLREAFLSLTPAGRAIYEDLAPIALEFARSGWLEASNPPTAHRRSTARCRQLSERSAALVGEAIANRQARRRRRRTNGGRGARVARANRKEDSVKLYSYFRSSAAYRVRIALNLKGLAYETVPVHLTKDGGTSSAAEFRAINPQMRVPALALSERRVLMQSLAIIDYLDEIHPEPPLLPADPLERAKVRALAQIIACDIHPLNNIAAAALPQATDGPGAERRSTPGTTTGSWKASRRWRR